MTGVAYTNKCDKLLTIFLAIFPLLDVYGTHISGLGFGDLLFLLLIPYMIWRLVEDKVHVNGPTLAAGQLLIFTAYCIFATLASLLIHQNYSIQDAAIRLLVEIFFVCIIFYFSASLRVDSKILIRVYRNFATMASIAIIVQFLFHHLLSTNIVLLAKNLPYNQSTIANYEQYVSKYERMYAFSYRPTSFFLEPSQYALFVAPCLAYLVNRPKQGKTTYGCCIVMSIGLILSTSGVGYVMLVIAWGGYLIKLLRHRIVKKRQIFLVGFVTISALYAFSYSGYSTVLVSRLNSISAGSGNSISVRLLKGFETYLSLPLGMKIFGMGCGLYESYALDVSSLVQYEYMNSFSYIMVATGFVGLILFVLFFFRLARASKSYQTNILVICLIAMYITGSTLFSCYDTLVICLILCENTNELAIARI